GRLAVGARLLEAGGAAGGRVRAAAAGLHRRRPVHAGPRRDEHLRPRLLGLPPGPLLVAARLLGGVPPQPVLGPGPRRLDARRLPVRRGLLGPAAVRPRPAVRPGPLPAGRGGRPLHLRAALRGPAGLPDQRDVRRPGPEPLLLRRLLRGALRET